MTDLDAIRTANAERMTAIGGIDPTLLLRFRVDALTAILLSGYPDEAHDEFELFYENIVSQVLDQAEGDLEDGANETSSD